MHSFPTRRPSDRLDRQLARVDSRHGRLKRGRPHGQAAWAALCKSLVWLTNLAGAQACGRESLVFLGKFYCAVHKNPLDCLRTWDYITVTPVFCAMQHLSAGLIPRGMRSPIMAVSNTPFLNGEFPKDRKSVV